jgi:hypothetical protein
MGILTAIAAHREELLGNLIPMILKLSTQSASPEADAKAFATVPLSVEQLALIRYLSLFLGALCWTQKLLTQLDSRLKETIRVQFQQKLDKFCLDAAGWSSLRGSHGN